MCNTYFVVRFAWFWFWQCTICIQWCGNAYTKCMVSLFGLRLLRVQVRHVTDPWLAVASACLAMGRARRGRRFFFLQTRIAIPQYFSQSYGAYFKHIVCTCTCAYTYCKCLRDVNDILRHIKIRAIWLAEMQSSFAEKKIARGPAARGQSVHGSVYCAYKWGMSQTDDSPSLIGAARRFFFLQTRIAIPQYFSQSYGAYFKHIVRTCTCAYTYCKCLRDVNDILRHIKIRAIWLAEMQSSFAEKKIARGRGPAARGQSVHGSVYCAYKWGVSQTDDSPSLIGLTPWRTMWSVCSRLRLLCVQLWGVSQTNDLPLIN